MMSFASTAASNDGGSGHRRLVFAFAGSILCALVLRAFSYQVTGLDWDESLYIVMAQRWLRGDLPYVHIWDQHPPGLPALLVLAQWLIGDGLLAARVAALVAVAGTSALAFAIVDRFAGRRLAAFLAAILYLIVMTRPDGLAGNTEVFNNLFVTAASYLLLPEMMRRNADIRIPRVLGAAVLLGIGLQIKYVVFPEAALFCSTVLVSAWWRGVSFRRIIIVALFAMVAGLLPTAAMAAYFWQAGALQPFLDANLRANIEYLGLPISEITILARLRYGLLPLVTLVVWLLLLPPLLRRQGDRRVRMLSIWLVIWLIAAAIDVALPLKFWKHYFNALLPPLSIVAALGCSLMARALPRMPVLATGVAFAVTVTPILALLAKHAPDSRGIDRLNVPRAIAGQIARSGGSAGGVYVFNYDPVVYAYAHAIPPTRYVLGIELANFSASSGANAVREVSNILETLPEWLIVAEPSPYKFAPAVWHKMNATLLDYRLEKVWQEYDYVQPTIEVKLYRRRDPARQVLTDRTGD